MQFTQTSAPLPATVKRIGVRGESKYNFAGMATGSGYETSDVVDAKKAAGRLTSAVASYKKRSGDNRVFNVRVFQKDGVDFVGVWVSEAAVPQVVQPA